MDMTATKIHTTNAPEAIGPYSQGMVCQGMVYTSGQIPIIPATGELCQGDITQQATQALENLSAVLVAGGSDCDHIVKTTCFLADMADFQAFNTVYANYIQGAPARSCVAVKTLPKNVLVEVEAIAVTKEV